VEPGFHAPSRVSSLFAFSLHDVVSHQTSSNHTPETAPHVDAADRGVQEQHPPGVTVDSEWLAGARSVSQRAANTGNASERGSPFLQRFAAVFRPFGTSLVQSGAIDAESVQWVSVREVAAILRVSTSTVTRRSRRGRSRMYG
jgi:hypothetical protein